MFCDSNSLRVLMNNAGADRTPFLFAIDYAMERAIFLPDPLHSKEVLWSIGSSSNILHQDNHLNRYPTPGMTIMQAPSAEEYSRSFNVVMEGLIRGDSFLTNLTRSTIVEASPLEDIFLASSAPYRLLIPDEFVCFSPETFVRISHYGTITAYPMKGTIDAGMPDARQRLENDPKELAEHYTIVDLLRNDLGIVAENVKVTRFRYFDRVSTRRGDIFQTSSEIEGTLPDGWENRLGEIIFSMLPAGSISGAPKEATLRIISKAEGEPRGWYTGVFGYFDGHSLDSAVMIRCLQRHNDGSIRFHSGGGITVNSDCESEYNELIQKIYLTR